MPLPETLTSPPDLCLLPLARQSVSLDDLTETEWKTLGQWEERFRNSYPIVGYLKGDSKPVSQIDIW